MMKQPKSLYIPVILLLGFAALLTVFPFIWMLLTSLKNLRRSNKDSSPLIP